MTAVKVTVITGTSAFTIPLPTTDAAGTLEHVGTSAFTIPLPTTDAAGISEHVGTSTFTIPLPTTDATGQVANIIGTSAFTIPLPTTNAAGVSEHVGTSDFTIPLPATSAASILEHIGASAFVIPLPTTTASGIVSGPGGGITGTSAFVIPLPITAASGSVNAPNPLCVPVLVVWQYHKTHNKGAEFSASIAEALSANDEGMQAYYFYRYAGENRVPIYRLTGKPGDFQAYAWAQRRGSRHHAAELLGYVSTV